MLYRTFHLDALDVVLFGHVNEQDVVALDQLARLAVSYYGYRRVALELQSARMTRRVADAVHGIVQRLQMRDVVVRVRRDGGCGRNSARIANEVNGPVSAVLSGLEPRRIGFATPRQGGVA